MAEFDALDDTGDDLAGAVLELLILPLALGVADLLEANLLGGLRGDAAELDRWQRIDDEIANACDLLQLLRVGAAYLLEITVAPLGYAHDPPQTQGARNG